MKKKAKKVVLKKNTGGKKLKAGRVVCVPPFVPATHDGHTCPACEFAESVALRYTGHDSLQALEEDAAAVGVELAAIISLLLDAFLQFIENWLNNCGGSQYQDQDVAKEATKFLKRIPLGGRVVGRRIIRRLGKEEYPEAKVNARRLWADFEATAITNEVATWQAFNALTRPDFGAW